MSNYRNAVYRRAHQERGQVTSRKRLGMLEKKKDYKLRAQDYHRKKDKLKELQEAAAQRNPDEFYFGMLNSHVKDGKHVVKRVGKKRSHSEMLEMKTQDLAYLENERLMEQKKIDKLLASSSMFHGQSIGGTRYVLDDAEGDDDDDDEEGASGEGSGGSKGSAEPLPAALVSVAAHYGVNQGAAVGKVAPKLSAVDLDQGVAQNLSKKDLKRLDKERLKKYRELLARIERKEKIDKQYAELAKQKLLMGKGRVTKKVKRDKFGDIIESETVYKWAAERKK